MTGRSLLRDAAIDALQELVDLKALKDRLDSDRLLNARGHEDEWVAVSQEYNRRKPIAWANAKAVLSAVEPAPSVCSVCGNPRCEGTHAVQVPEDPLPVYWRDSTESFVRHLLWGQHPECCGNMEIDVHTLGGERCCGQPDLADLNDAQIVATLRAKFPDTEKPVG